MKLLHIIITLIITFVVAIATSALLDIPWVSMNWARQSLVVLLLAIELFLGFVIFKEILK